MTQTHRGGTDRNPWHRNSDRCDPTNGNAERFIQTALREWAYARSYQNLEERKQKLEPLRHDYNFRRSHSSHPLLAPV